MNKIAAVLFSMIVGLGFLTGCGSSSGDDWSNESQAPSKPSKGVERGQNYTRVDISIYKEVYMVDIEGTKCAVSFNDKATSIDCDWKK